MLDYLIVSTLCALAMCRRSKNSRKTTTKQSHHFSEINQIHLSKAKSLTTKGNEKKQQFLKNSDLANYSESLNKNRQVQMYRHF